MRFYRPAVSSDKLVRSWTKRGVVRVFVPDAARRCVVFVGSKEGDGTFRPRATGFLVMTSRKGGDFLFPHLVTAEHVIVGMRAKQMDIYCRLNMHFSDPAVIQIADEWRFHPDEHQKTDVAILPFVPPFTYNLMDQQAIILPNPADQDKASLGYGLTAPQPAGLGDEIFIIGLFKSHYGKEKNVPIVRIGNIAAMPEEPVFTTYAGYIDAYLAEVRSIAGLSGSPVFVNIPERRAASDFGPTIGPDGKPTEIVSAENRSNDVWFKYNFLGLVHGHFDVPNLREDAVVDDGSPGSVNTGIGIVVPASKIYETLYDPELVAERLEMEKQLRQEPRNGCYS
jgi:hypothetical protein